MMKKLLGLIFLGFATLCKICEAGEYATYNQQSHSTTHTWSRYLLPAWGDKDEQAALISLRDQDWDGLLQNVAGTPERQNVVTQTVRELNLLMRENYQGFMKTVGFNIFPVIIASDYEPDFQGVGSTYKLYLRDGTIKHISPTPSSYERNKALSHMTLSIFTLVSPYFTNPSSVRPGPLLKYAAKVKETLDVMENAKDVPKIDQERYLKLLRLGYNYLNAVVQKGAATPEDFMAYADQAVVYIEDNMKDASTQQVNHVLPALEQWKAELGPEEWSKLYAIIPTVWPVGDYNPRQQIFEKIMDPDKIKTHIIKVENSSGDDFSRMQLGRVVGDRTMSQMVFGVSTPSRIDHLLSLSTRRDLVSTGCEAALKNYAECKIGKSLNDCPYKKST